MQSCDIASNIQLSRCNQFALWALYNHIYFSPPLFCRSLFHCLYYKRFIVNSKCTKRSTFFVFISLFFLILYVFLYHRPKIKYRYMLLNMD
nr:MAG TPA: hypothetical protein [Caudoviricetes sp.]